MNKILNFKTLKYYLNYLTGVVLENRCKIFDIFEDSNTYFSTSSRIVLTCDEKEIFKKPYELAKEIAYEYYKKYSNTSNPYSYVEINGLSNGVDFSIIHDMETAEPFLCFSSSSEGYHVKNYYFKDKDKTAEEIMGIIKPNNLFTFVFREFLIDCLEKCPINSLKENFILIKKYLEGLERLDLSDEANLIKNSISSSTRKLILETI